MDESTNSCGITSCHSMVDREIDRQRKHEIGSGAVRNTVRDVVSETGQKSIREPLCVDGPALLRELERLRAGLASLLGQKIAEKRVGNETGSSDRLLVLSCLARGVTMEQWRSLCSQYDGAEDWFVFELDPARNPQLAASSAKGVSLQQAVCPETGVLLAPFFVKTMGTELDKARKTGNGPTLVLFEIVDGTCRPEPRATGKNRREPSLSQIFSGQVDPDVLDRPEVAAPASTAASSLSAPVSLDVKDSKDVKDVKDEKGRLARLPLLAQTLRAHARGCDVPGRMEHTLALLMPGAGALRARAFAERLVLAFDEALRRVSGGQVVRLALRAGIAACEIDDIPDADTLVSRCRQALDVAQPGGTRTWRKNDMGVSERRTQVQACEKQFLFFGAPESS